MELLDIEKTIEQVLYYSKDIQAGVHETPLYSYFHCGTEFSYMHTVDKDSDSHRVLVEGKPAFDVDLINKQVEYMIDGIIIKHKLDIAEEWHFQLSTVQPMISFEHLQMVNKILNIIA